MPIILISFLLAIALHSARSGTVCGGTVANGISKHRRTYRLIRWYGMCVHDGELVGETTKMYDMGVNIIARERENGTFISWPYAATLPQHTLLPSCCFFFCHLPLPVAQFIWFKWRLSIWKGRFIYGLTIWIFHLDFNSNLSEIGILCIESKNIFYAGINANGIFVEKRKFQ